MNTGIVKSKFLDRKIYLTIINSQFQGYMTERSAQTVEVWSIWLNKNTSSRSLSVHDMMKVCFYWNNASVFSIFQIDGDNHRRHIDLKNSKK